ncbi:MAG: ABC transporter substrate-binding protein [Gammaproteobacteria bacterium]|nr:ABC transporter substrate-binding protein [Gammaproteobacteria bacterium]MDH5653730.1 ABC transporter substrate-binding protein [Gammaproteobacteria bacterium]
MQLDVIRLGLMPPLTGLVGIYGTEIARAGQIACAEINEQGGVLGRPLELMIEDDGSLPESAVAAATKLIEEHHCVALVGNLLSNSRIAVAYRVAEPNKIPYLNFSFYEGSILSRYFFHFAALPNQQIEKMIPYMYKHFGPRMFFAGNNYEWPRGSIDAAKRILLELGGEVLGEEYTPIGVLPAVLERLLDKVEIAAPDVFVPYFAGADQVNLLTRFTERGMKSKMAVVMGHYDELMAGKLPAEVRDGFYSSNTYFMTIDNAENRRYLHRMANYPGVSGIWPEGNGILTNFGEGTYLCVKAFAQAANAAGSIHSEALVDALNSIRLNSPQGTVQMDPVTQHATVNTYLTRCNADGVFDIVESFGAIAPVLPERYSHQRVENRATMEEDIRLQSRMLEQMSEGVMLIESAGGRVIYTNGGAERMFGTSKEEAQTKTMEELLYGPPEERHVSMQGIYAILNHKGVWQGNLQYLRKDGESLWCYVSMSAFTHPVYGEVWMSVCRDITEQRRVESELERYQRQLEYLVTARTSELKEANEHLHSSLTHLRRTQSQLVQAEKMASLGGMVAGIAHEINTPIGVGVTAVSHLKMKLENYNFRYKNNTLTREDFEVLLTIAEETSRIIGSNLDRAADLIRSFKQVAVDQIIDEQRTIYIKTYCEEIFDSMIPILKSAGHTVNVKCHNELQITCNPGALFQIFTNLINNSVIHGFANLNNGLITIEVNKTEAGLISIDYSDNGCGMDQETVQKVFEPFFTTRRGQGGTGLGMHIVYNLVTGSLHGQIECHSTVGEGVSFHIEFGEGTQQPLLHSDTVSPAIGARGS